MSESKPTAPLLSAVQPAPLLPALQPAPLSAAVQPAVQFTAVQQVNKLDIAQRQCAHSVALVLYCFNTDHCAMYYVLYAFDLL